MKIKILLAVIGLFALAATSQAQFNSLSSPVQTITVPAGVTGATLTNASTTAVVGSAGFSFMATIGGTNAATTGNISYLWRVSHDGSSTNMGAAIYTNVLVAPGLATNRYYGVVPASAINGGVVHLTISNGGDATNRITTGGSVTVVAFP